MVSNDVDKNDVTGSFSVGGGYEVTFSSPFRTARLEWASLYTQLSVLSKVVHLEHLGFAPSHRCAYHTE